MKAPTSLQLRVAIAACIIISCCGLSAASKVDLEERKAVIEAAIADVKDEIALKESAKAANINSAEKKLHSFKMASVEALAQGHSRLKFEKMVKRAESKILVKQRQASVQTAEERVESLAMEFLHTPGSLLTEQEIARMYQESGCPRAVPQTPSDCDAFTQQRSASGVCNNLENPTFGAANTPMRRLIQPRYDDGISRLQGTLQIRRVSIVPGPFSPPNPSPRVVSIGVVQDRPENDTQFSHILMQWGQFMDHDLDAIPEFEPSECKGCEVEDDTCVPFPVPEDDDDISRIPGSDSEFCLGFRRSLPACSSEGTMMAMEPREQFNGLSHFIDGSMVYSHVESVQETLIRNQSSPDGLLNVGPPAKGTTRPSLPAADGSGVVACPAGPCFLAGDFRVNEHTALTVMHTIWLREHNRIATTLRGTNPQMSSDQIFQTTRNIVIAMIQKITFKDYVPLLLGDMSRDLIPDYSGYDSTVDPNVPNAFATAAYRFGHSQLQPFFERLDGSYKSIPAGPLSLVDAFFDTSQFTDNGGTDPILRGLLTRKARLVDEFLNSVLTSRLFSEGPSSPGLDLASLNIQRGRDHGLPSYLTWKQWAKERCGGVESGFRNQLTQIHLLQTYGGLGNVDLFVGGLAEEPLPGGVVGAIFACIFANTFRQLRDGDRFYYENAQGPTSPLFTADQREEVEKASLSRVICDNTDIDQVQPNAFMANQDRVSCSQLPAVDLSRWSSSDNQLCYLRYSTGNVGSAEYIAVSRQFSPQRMTRTNRRTLVGMGTDCLSFLCPQENRKVRLIVLSSNSCPIQGNMNLPGRSRFSNQFRAWVSREDVQSKNGLYTSLGSCLGGSNVGVSFCMSGGPDNKVVEVTGHAAAAVEQTQEVDKFVSDDELRHLLPDLPMDHLEEIFGGAPGTVVGGAQGGGGGSKDLIALMEEVLESLKATQSVEAMYVPPPPPPPPPHQDDHMGDHKESSIVELEDALKQLN